MCAWVITKSTSVLRTKFVICYNTSLYQENNFLVLKIRNRDSQSISSSLPFSNKLLL